MHVHLPKPLHGWRALVGEVGIIVVGVLIALAAEQAVESWRWHEKVAAAKKNIDFELNDELLQVDEVEGFQSCTIPFVDALESAILRHDRSAIEKLYSTRPPFEPRPWRSTAWRTAMSTAVADHFDTEDVNKYEFLFSSFDDMLAAQNSVISDFAEATTGRLGGPVDPTSTAMQLMAAERLRTQLLLLANIAASEKLVADGKVFNWKPIDRHPRANFKEAIAREGALCKATVKSVS